MSGRGFETAVTDDIDANRVVRIISFAKVEIGGSNVYLHDDIGTITWTDPVDGSQDWLGVGDFASVSTIEDGTVLSPYKIELILSGIDNTLSDEFLNQPYKGSPITIYMGYWDIANDQLLAGHTPKQVWSGTIDTATVTFGFDNNNAIKVTCESELKRLDQANGSVFSDADIQKDYPGDLFFEYLSDMVDAQIVWRGKSQIGYADRAPTIPDYPRNITFPS